MTPPETRNWFKALDGTGRRWIDLSRIVCVEVDFFGGAWEIWGWTAIGASFSLGRFDTEEAAVECAASLVT